VENHVIVKLNALTRYDLECHGYSGDAMYEREGGDWVRMDDVVEALGLKDKGYGPNSIYAELDDECESI